MITVEEIVSQTDQVLYQLMIADFPQIKYISF